MRTLTKTELNNILELHKKWLTAEDDGVKADLSNAELCGAGLSNADLRGADLYYADLYDANLRGANLCRADLYDANLRGANLCRADLYNANLRGANLCGADLRGANLYDANLYDANLRGANLCGADLRGADLNWINWHEAKGVKAYVAGLQSSRDNAQLAYIPSLDIATTGCWQDNWTNTKKRIHGKYAKGTRERKVYDLAIEYINKQVELDSYEK